MAGVCLLYRCASAIAFSAKVLSYVLVFLVRNVTILLQLALSFINISGQAEILLYLQTKCNNYFRKQKHL